MLYTTLNLLKKEGACTNRYLHLLKKLGGAKRYGYDTPIRFDDLLKMNGLADSLWALRAVSDEQARERDFVARIFVTGCAEHVLLIYEKRFPGDNRVQLCIESACLYAWGELTRQELFAAKAAAYAAAYAAYDAAAYAANATDAAAYAAYDAAAYATNAAYAAYAANAAYAAYAANAADVAESNWQKEMFLRLLINGLPEELMER
jgi:hypothetical protein